MFHRVFAILISFGVSISFAQETELKQLDLNDEVHVKAEVLKSNSKIPHGTFLKSHFTITQVSGAYRQGKKHGTWKRLYENGAVMIEGKYHHGKPNGVWKRYAADGSLLASFEYKNGVPIGHWQGFFQANRKAVDLIYSNNLLSQAILYYPSGKPAMLFEQSISNGDTLVYESLYYPNDKIARYKSFKNNLKHGSFIRYHINGSRLVDLDYSKDRLFSVNALRAMSGQPLVVGAFKNGTGDLKMYYPNGLIYSTSEYRKGLKHGLSTTYLNGKSIYEGYFDLGNPIGEHELRDSDYSLELRLDFADGDSVLITRFLSAATKEIETGYLKNGLRTGKWFYTNPYGDTTEVASYKNGLLHGQYTAFTPSGGAKKLSGMYAYGGKSGTWKTFNTLGQVTFENTYNVNRAGSFFMKTRPYEFPLLIEEEFGYWRINEDALAKPFYTKNLASYVPNLPGLREKSAQFSYEYQVVEKLQPEQDEVLLYEPYFSSAQFPGEQSAEEDYFINHPILNEKAEEIGVQGSILLRFKVDELGLIDEVELIRGIHPIIDAGAVEFIRQMPVWIPASYNGIPIPSYILKRIDIYYE